MIEPELKKVIVDQGGAYGSGCLLTSNGTLSLYSFKDPHTIQTYESFEKATLMISNGVFTYFSIIFLEKLICLEKMILILQNWQFFLK